MILLELTRRADWQGFAVAVLAAAGFCLLSGLAGAITGA